MIDQSRRLASVQTPVIPVISRWIAETPGTISLGQGVVRYGPPAEALEALRRFPESPADHRYGPVEGEPALIDALEAKLARENATTLDEGRRIVVTAGSNQAFMNAILAVTDPGDEVICPVPYYFNHEMAIVMAGAVPVPVPAARDHQLDVEAIARAITARTRAVVTVSPNNPTGAVYRESDLRALNALCASRGLFHIHDEAYEYFTYDGAAHFSPGSIAGASAHTISLYSLSKAYGFASWRIGYMVIPGALWDAVNKIQDTLLICPPAVSQHVALAAVRIGAGYTRSHLPALDAIRRKVAAILNDAPVPCDLAQPGGAFYYFVRVHTLQPALQVTEALVRRHRVAVIPGTAFGAGDGCFLRVSYGALDEPTAVEGANRLAEGLKAIVAAS